MTTCIMCEHPNYAPVALGDWDLCEAHAAAVVKVEPAEAAELVCEGSGRRPVTRRGKPHCAVCGEAFRWSDLEDRVQFIPVHF